MKLFDVYPINDITITRAQGSFVWDDHDQRYLDLYGGHAVISIGHTHPHYVERITEQLRHIGFYSNSIHIRQQEELAAKLGRVSGRDDYQLFLCNSGAEANENALKLASFVTGRKKIVAFSGSFHGRTSLAVAATDNPAIVAPVNRTDNIIFLPFNDPHAVEACFQEQGHEIAAVIVEGIQGVGGIRVATPAFLQQVRACCTKYGAIFIADSVQCGYGRSGKFFSQDFAEVNADIYSMAKGMGNGFPVAGILISSAIPARHSMLGTTFGGNYLACAAALAVLEVMEEQQLMQNASELGDYLMAGLKKFPQLQNVRGKGLMIGFDVPEELKELRKNLLWKHHIFTGESKPNVVRLLPSLALTRQEADLFLEAVGQEVNLLIKSPNPVY